MDSHVPAGPLPATLASLGAYAWHTIDLGCSGAHVHRLTTPGEPTLFLKSTDTAHAGELRDEAERLAWLQGKLPVPKLVHYLGDTTGAYLVTEAVRGQDLTEFNHGSDAAKRQMTVELAWGLRRVHALDSADCPFDHTPARQLARLEARLRGYWGKAVRTKLEALHLLLDKLKAEQPEAEDLVFTHGDPCLPNILVEGDRLSGFIDLGSAGLGDCYRDLALARWSLGYNFGRGYDALFFNAYGLPEPDEARLAFHQAVEQFSFNHMS